MSDAAVTPVYGLDIETDTATDGLDPQVGRILCIGISGSGGELVLAHHDEAALLADLDDWLADMTPGVLATWNGSAFDLPYLATRARAPRGRPSGWSSNSILRWCCDRVHCPGTRARTARRGTSTHTSTRIASFAPMWGARSGCRVR